LIKVNSLIMFRKFWDLSDLPLNNSIFAEGLQCLAMRLELELPALNPRLVLLRFTAEFELNNLFWIFSSWPYCDSPEILLLDSRWIEFLPSDKLLLFRFANILFSNFKSCQLNNFLVLEFLNWVRFGRLITKND
jgi:hypothetical protein